MADWMTKKGTKLNLTALNRHVGLWESHYHILGQVRWAAKWGLK
jgi:hypothetical protein